MLDFCLNWTIVLSTPKIGACMEYVSASNISHFYLSHVNALEPCSELPEGQSFALSLESLSIALLRDIVTDSYNVGKVAIVVIEHPEAIEVQRLPDGTNVKLFYRYLSAASYKATSATDKIKEVCKEYCKGMVETYSTYDSNITVAMIEDKIISYVLIQRKLANISIFRNAPEGSTKRFKSTIAELVKQSFLKEVPKQVAVGRYNTKSKLFEINLN